MVASVDLGERASLAATVSSASRVHASEVEADVAIVMDEAELQYSCRKLKLRVVNAHCSGGMQVQEVSPRAHADASLDAVGGNAATA